MDVTIRTVEPVPEHAVDNRLVSERHVVLVELVNPTVELLDVENVAKFIPKIEITDKFVVVLGIFDLSAIIKIDLSKKNRPHNGNSILSIKICVGWIPAPGGIDEHDRLESDIHTDEIHLVPPT
jgi:hypothetical protein